MHGRVAAEGDWIRVWADGRLLDEQNLKDLTRIYDVNAGSDIDVTNPDVDFHVFAFSNKAWVLPNKTEGVAGVIYQTWRDHISKFKLYYFADLDELPRHWRKSWLGGLVRTPEPLLLVLPSLDIPNWRLRGPLEPGTIPPRDMSSRRDLDR